jgi:aspartyl protease family protein
MNEWDGARFVYLLLCLMFVASGLFARRLPVGPTLKMMAMWIGIFAGIYVLFLFRGEGQAIWNRITADISGSGGESAGSAMRIRQRDDGHYYVKAKINGTEAELMVDSGATFTTINRRTAEAAGIEPDSGPDVLVMTANGLTKQKSGKAAEFRVGTIVQRGARLHIDINKDDVQVLGMSFLSNLKSWRIEGDTLTFEP